MRITIVGAGPGGLVAAIAARKRGLDVEVLEQAPELRAVGAGIVLQINALRMLATLGLDEEIVAGGAVLDEGRIERADGTLLQTLDLRPMRERYGQPAVAIHRGTLSAILAGHLSPGTVRYGVRVTARDGAVVGPDGHPLAGDVVVGADGLHSEVRGAVVGDVAPRYAGYVAWRGISDTCVLPPGVSCERWGRGRRLGLVPIGPDRSYWFATEDVPEGGRDPDDLHPVLLEKFAEFGEDAAAVIRATPRAAILRNDIVDLPPIDTWIRGNVVLLGDAAHAMTPNLGQGACQAVEDAVVLAAELGRPGTDVPSALARYVDVRQARARSLQRMSDRMGNIGQWSHPVLTGLREVVFRTMPQWIVRRQLEELFGVAVPS
jgi:2-polyprenyl-6-methoxyphenol hydroxylase-like FAD-dependent oxidoreductase